MNIYLFVKEDSVIHGWSSTYSDGAIEYEIDDYHEFLSSNPRLFKLINGEILRDDSALLDIKKQAKIRRLVDDCNKTILGRFSAMVNGVTYMFSCDMEAQANFEKLDKAFKDGTMAEMGMTSIGWTAYDADGSVVRLDLTYELFRPVYINHLLHIQNNISKLRDFLEPLVANATTVEEIESITW